MRKFVARIGGIVAVAVVSAAVMVPPPAQAQVPNLPPYARPSASAQETIHGRIEAIHLPFDLLVRDDRGFVDVVRLHPGTIISPRGLRLAVGMTVTIIGYNTGSELSAIEIDTPYAYDPSASPSYYSNDYGYYYPYALGFGLTGATIIEVQQPPVVSQPPQQGVPRGIERPQPGHPVRRNPDEPSPSPAPSSPPSPSYVLGSHAPSQPWWGGPQAYRGWATPWDRGAAGTQTRGATSDVRQPGVSQGPSQQRSEPARGAPARTEPARSEPARSEPARSAPPPAAPAPPARSEPKSEPAHESHQKH